MYSFNKKKYCFSTLYFEGIVLVSMVNTINIDPTFEKLRASEGNKADKINE